MIRFRRSAARLAAPLLLCATVAACGDSPTLPTSFARDAGGVTWVAVREPAGLPDARSWLPYLSAADAARVRQAQAAADAERAAGRLEAAQEMDAEARLSAASLLAADPPPVRIRAALGALLQWESRAAERLDAGRYPALRATAAVVSARRAEAEAALARDEPRIAVLRVAEGAEAARSASPVAVALRLVDRAEQRIDGDPSPSANLRRARLLLRLSREAMATGDQTRAMKRAFYALQLIDADDARPGR
ncbi:MAG TPA: hypothetical protein VGO40_21870 [Longimicrobium sp.]|jgi:hypothetical protein|nr:hypothetical protein [Longimicrobium sp.]